MPWFLVCNVRVLPLDPSSDESDGENNGYSTCDDASDVFPVEDRCHVICIDPAVASRPLWCNSTPVHEFKEIKQWLVKAREYSLLFSSSKDIRKELQ